MEQEKYTIEDLYAAYLQGRNDSHLEIVSGNTQFHLDNVIHRKMYKGLHKVLTIKSVDIQKEYTYLYFEQELCIFKEKPYLCISTIHFNNLMEGFMKNNTKLKEYVLSYGTSGLKVFFTKGVIQEEYTIDYIINI